MIKFFKSCTRSYKNASTKKSVEEINPSKKEFDALKEAFNQINTKFQQTRLELTETAIRFQECENQFSNTFDNLFNGLLIIDIYTDKEGKPFNHKFVRANKVAEKLIGLKAEDLIGKSSKDLGLEWPPELLYRLYEVTRKGKPIEYERYNETVGKYFHTQVFSPGSGQLAFVFDDITERKETENQLLSAKEKAEISDRLKTAFLMNLSHEIRTPMNAILGFLDLLKEPDLDDSQKNEYIDIVNKSGERLLDTINDIIEISRIEAGETELSDDLVEIDNMMQYYYNSFKKNAELKGLTFKLSLNASKDFSTVKADRGKLESILTNLIKNAIKFTKEGGIEIGYYSEGNNLVVFVKDTGCGIPTDRFEVIFERFVQADTSVSRTHEGSGLGLAIVKAYTEAMRGKVWLESVVDKGSAFYVSFPIHIEKKPDVPAKSLPEDLTILVVEDDELSYQYYEILLAPYCKLIHERTGADAIDRIEKDKDISLILMDIKMPGKIDGFEATKLIREMDKEIPIIAQTAFAMEIDRQKAIQAGCNDYITKPVSRTNLLSIISKHCQTEV